MCELLEEGLTRGEYDPEKPECATTKAIYMSRAQDVMLPPKVEDKFPDLDFVNLVYPRLTYRILDGEARDILFCLVHGLVHNRDRMFRQGRAQDPYCQLPDCPGKVQDVEHLFCSCTLVAESWDWLRTKLLQILPEEESDVQITNHDLLSLQFPATLMDKEWTWLLGSYCSQVKKTVLGRKRKLGRAALAGKLRSYNV